MFYNVRMACNTNEHKHPTPLNITDCKHFITPTERAQMTQSAE